MRVLTLVVVLVVAAHAGCRRQAGEAPPEDELLRALQSAPPGTEVELALAILGEEGQDLYGAADVAEAAREAIRVSEDRRTLVVLRALTPALALMGCARAAAGLGELPPSEHGEQLARTCPGGEPAVDPERARGAPVWAVALAIRLELQARERDREGTALHHHLRDALLGAK